jgi:hypothetical protein
MFTDFLRIVAWMAIFILKWGRFADEVSQEHADIFLDVHAIRTPLASASAASSKLANQVSGGAR